MEILISYYILMRSNVSYSHVLTYACPGTPYPILQFSNSSQGIKCHSSSPELLNTVLKPFILRSLLQVGTVTVWYFQAGPISSLIVSTYLHSLVIISFNKTVHFKFISSIKAGIMFLHDRDLSLLLVNNALKSVKSKGGLGFKILLHCHSQSFTVNSQAAPFKLHPQHTFSHYPARPWTSGSYGFWPSQGLTNLQAHQASVSRLLLDSSPATTETGRQKSLP